jgi:hypothetical protein
MITVFSEVLLRLTKLDLAEFNGQQSRVRWPYQSNEVLRFQLRYTSYELSDGVACCLPFPSGPFGPTAASVG